MTFPLDETALRRAIAFTAGNDGWAIIDRVVPAYKVFTPGQTYDGKLARANLGAGLSGIEIDYPDRAPIRFRLTAPLDGDGFEFAQALRHAYDYACTGNPRETGEYSRVEGWADFSKFSQAMSWLLPRGYDVSQHGGKNLRKVFHNMGGWEFSPTRYERSAAPTFLRPLPPCRVPRTLEWLMAGEEVAGQPQDGCHSGLAGVFHKLRDMPPFVLADGIRVVVRCPLLETEDGIATFHRASGTWTWRVGDGEEQPLPKSYWVWEGGFFLEEELTPEQRMHAGLDRV
jgi:hypothetical protein